MSDLFVHHQACGGCAAEKSSPGKRACKIETGEPMSQLQATRSEHNGVITVGIDEAILGVEAYLLVSIARDKGDVIITCGFKLSTV